MRRKVYNGLALFCALLTLCSFIGLMGFVVNGELDANTQFYGIVAFGLALAGTGYVTSKLSDKAESDNIYNLTAGIVIDKRFLLQRVSGAPQWVVQSEGWPALGTDGEQQAWQLRLQHPHKSERTGWIDVNAAAYSTADVGADFSL